MNTYVTDVPTLITDMNQNASKIENPSRSMSLKNGYPFLTTSEYYEEPKVSRTSIGRQPTVDSRHLIF